MNERYFNKPAKINKAFEKGQIISIETESGIQENKIINILDSKKACTVLGLKYNIKSPVPILILEKHIGDGSAHYHPGLKVILAYDDTQPKVMHHEIIHSLEMQKPMNSEIRNFYEKVLEEIPDTNNIQPNFRKNIHEFIADAYTKEGLIENLKQKGLYEEFKKLSSYIFD